MHLTRVLQATFKSPLVKNLEKLTEENRTGPDTAMFLLRRIKAFVQGASNKKLVTLITSGKWADQLETISKIKNPDTQLGGLLELLGQVSARGATAGIIKEQ